MMMMRVFQNYVVDFRDASIQKNSLTFIKNRKSIPTIENGSLKLIPIRIVYDFIVSLLRCKYTSLPIAIWK